MATVFMALSLISAYHTRQETGVLRVSTTDKTGKAVLSASRDNFGAEILGLGQANVRLTPGNYHISAILNGKQTSGTARIEQGQAKDLKLDFAKSTQLPSVLDINFDNTEEFINKGLSQAQVNAIKKAIFSFKRSVQSVIIVRNSVQPAPRNPDVDIGFSDDFVVTIDNKNYKANIKYDNFSTVQLSLRDSKTGTVVFTSK